MKNVITVWKEIFANRERIFRLARYEQRAKTNGTILGRLWEFLTPVLQICVYWFVFAVGLRVKSMQGDTPYSVWMMAGMIPWFCVSGSMQSSAAVITSSANIIRNLNIPMTIIPAKNVVMHLMEHLWMVVFLLFMLIVSGVKVTLYWLQILYFFACMVIFLVAFSMFASSVGTVVKDFGRILSPLIRLLFYLSSVILSLDGMSPTLQRLLKINPVTYIVMGYRNSLLYEIGIWEMGWHSLCFWTVTLVLMVVGCTLHMRTRENFVDML